MFSRFAVILLFSSLVWGQAETPNHTSQEPQLVTRQSGAQSPNDAGSGTPALSAETPSLLVSSYSRHNELRRGRDEEIVLVLCTPMRRFHYCPLSAISDQTGLEPLSLELKPSEGFTVRYREGKEFRTQQQGPAVPTEIGPRVFRLKVRASDNVALGPHTLEGKLTFMKTNAGRLPEMQEIDVSIPLTVVKHGAQVVEANWSLEQPGNHDVGTKILLALTAPIWGPVVLAFVAIYEISGD